MKNTTIKYDSENATLDLIDLDSGEILISGQDWPLLLDITHKMGWCDEIQKLARDYTSAYAQEYNVVDSDLLNAIYRSHYAHLLNS